MAAKSLGTDDLSVPGGFKSLGSPAFGLHFRHIATLLAAFT
jgi:hypothetical protein